jgi:hypothetical protein
MCHLQSQTVYLSSVCPMEYKRPPLFQCNTALKGVNNKKGVVDVSVITVVTNNTITLQRSAPLKG